MRKPADSEIDTPEMIQRCLNCELRVCHGLESCASGRALQMKQCRDTYNTWIIEMVLAGKKTA